MVHTFSIPVLAHKDGTLAVVDSDIKGLILEVNSIKELLEELPRIASRLLQLNHGLTEEEIPQVELSFEIVPFVEKTDKIKSNHLHSLPTVSWRNMNYFPSLQYA